MHETIDNNIDKVPEKSASHIITPIVPDLPSVLDSLSQLSKFEDYDFDTGDELVSGYGSFFDNTLTITYFNNSYFFYGDREQVPPGQNPGDPKRPWLCGMSMGLAGTIWSAAAGIASLGAGFIVSLSFTALTIWICD